jgi:Ni2+-binding GTPase involved in maturation of urease and hydrogenase
MGKKHCHAKQIPEDILLVTTASVLGLADFDAEVFKERIREIRIPAFNHLIYEFKDGTSIERVWQDKSRSDRWDENMRDQAAENARKRWEK